MDFIITGVPINKQAGEVVQSGEQHKFNRSRGLICTQKPISFTTYKNPKGFDCTGIRLGKIVVLGFRPKRGGQDRGRWVVKCDCGNYFTLKTKTIKNKTVNECPDCRQLRILKNKYSTIGR